jgi:hypothetical protein
MLLFWLALVLPTITIVVALAALGLLATAVRVLLGMR